MFLEFVPFPGVTDGMSELPPVPPERGMCQSKGLEVEQGAGWRGGRAEPCCAWLCRGELRVGSALGAESRV